MKLEVWLDSPQFLKRCGRVYLDGAERKILSAKVQKNFLNYLIKFLSSNKRRRAESRLPPQSSGNTPCHRLFKMPCMTAS